MRSLCFDHVPAPARFREGAEHGTRGACAPNACLPMLILTGIMHFTNRAVILSADDADFADKNKKSA
jgi:hypothetical protein